VFLIRVNFMASKTPADARRVDGGGCEWLASSGEATPTTI
jgi:hypothetical protein